VDGTYILRYHVGDRAAVDERLRAEIAWVSWPPWGDRQFELFYDIYSTHADLMRRAYRATHGLSSSAAKPRQLSSISWHESVKDQLVWIRSPARPCQRRSADFRLGRAFTGQARTGTACAAFKQSEPCC
jgi:hypothetical protein